jgi:photosystem II stability/assembly factor-like uncharacterized protein
MFYKHKLVLVFFCVALLAAACNPLGSGASGGVVKTGNGGADWQLANTIKDQRATLAGYSISKLDFDPSDPQKLLAGTFNNGVYLSEDGGNSWQGILGQLSVYDFAVNPADAKQIYAAGVFDNHGRVLKTSDNGNSWVEVFNEASTQNPVRSIALNPNNPEEVVIGLGYGTLIKSQDGGQSWRLLQNYNDRINRIYWNNNGMYVVVRNTGVFRSTDSGGSFQNIVLPLLPSGGRFGQLISSSGIATFNQIGLSSIDPSLVYLTTSGGLFRSTDSGATWNYISLPLRQRDLPIIAIAVAPSNSNIIYVSAGSNIYKSNDSGGSWQAQDAHPTGSINYILINPTLPQIAYAGVYIP